MKNISISEEFIAALEAKIPKKSELADLIADTLIIEKESAYRRLRGDVHFSLQEAILLSKKLNISLDKLTDIAPLKSRPFYLKLTNYAKPQDIDIEMIKEWNYVLREVADDPTVKFGGTAKMFPDMFHLGFENIERFYFFKWLYQYGDNSHGVKYKDVKVSPKIIDLLAEMNYLLQQIKSVFYIFDNNVFKNFIQDVCYFSELELIDSEDIKLIANDLMNLIDHMEELASQGGNKYGSKIDIYITNVDFETGTIYIDSDKYKLVFIRCFTLHDIASLDSYTLETVKQWMQSLKRSSLQISECAEIQRKKFFNEQRKYVNKLTNNDC